MNTKKTAYSLLEVAFVSQGNSIQQTLNNSLKLAQHAESLHYKRFWFAEHHNAENIASTATSVLIGYVANNTHTIRVGAGGIMLPNHSPLIIAEHFGTLAHLYPNRIDLGLGRAPGTDQETARAIRSDFMYAAQSFPHEIEKIQAYFSAENKEARVRATLAEGTDVPIYILGSSTDSAHLAAKKGLPYAFASHFASAHLFNALSIYREEFKPSAYLQQPYTIAGINVIVADTDEEAEKIYTSAARVFIGILSGDKKGLQPPTAMTEDLKEVLKHPTLAQFMKYYFVGSKQTVKELTQQFMQETQVDELIVSTATYDFEDRLKSTKLFAEIMMEINEQK